MDLMEYQAKELFARHDVPVTLGRVVHTAEDARAAAAEIGTTVVVKAQVKTGGRGKAGGVKLAKDPEEAYARAKDILGLDIKGHSVRTVLVAPAAEIAEEYYFSFLVDRANRTYLAIASVEGGVEIEEVARIHPDAVAKIPIDPATGVDAAQAREIASAARFPEAVRDDAVEVITKLWQVFVAEDATLVEVNPLVQRADGRLEALDGKITLDDNATFRHAEHEAYEDVAATDPLEQRAREKGLNYVKLAGQVGIIGNGAGLVMSTLDVVAYTGAEFGGSGGSPPQDGTVGVRPANFLDIGGGASAEIMANGLEIVLSDPDVRSVFVNVFGGITACDSVANGIVQALVLLAERGEHITKRLVVRLDGNNAELGRQILTDAGHPLVEQVDTMDGAARRAAELAATEK